MKTIIERVFPKKQQPKRRALAPSASEVSSELTLGDIENYYLRIIYDCLRRLTVPVDSVEIGVKRSGSDPQGLPAYAGYVRLLRWDPLAPVLLQNIPVIDARIRKVVAASVILEHTHFAGLWFSATSTTPGAPQALVGLPAELVRRPTPDSA